ncbi:hypothetical protein ANCDUO_01198 [Ancylostoma duodenale]|uniref:Uncharacterized protein n=1 Tax=Ancylostoma duodenale TaxID=51022 RepID=A0A0C2HFV0_9BILA|nr:hypothetical protein ANCDUO_01198 [Ancylostoma duodenale]
MESAPGIFQQYIDALSLVTGRSIDEHKARLENDLHNLRTVLNALTKKDAVDARGHRSANHPLTASRQHKSDVLLTYFNLELPIISRQTPPTMGLEQSYLIVSRTDPRRPYTMPAVPSLLVRARLT